MNKIVALKLIVSACLIAWLLSRTPLTQIGTTLGSLHPAGALGALALTLIAWWISALRLWCIAPEFRFGDVVQLTLVALYYSTVLPGQVAGDVIKAHRLSKRQTQPGHAVAATLVDRVVATFALFFLGACATPWVTQAPPELTLLLVVVAVLFLLGIVLLAQTRGHTLLARWKVPKQLARLPELLSRLLDGLHRLLKHPVRMFLCFLLALIFHGLCTAIQIQLAHAIGFSLPVAVWFLVYAGVALLMLLPISIAGVGLREGGYVGLLGMFGVAAPQALALSLMLFAYTLLGALLGWAAELMDRPRR